MGCDIHLHAEVKINGKWHHYDKGRVDRNYRLFARMANVRNAGDVEPIAEPRGLPDDATELTRFESERMGTDGHSHSYLTAQEIYDLVQWMKKPHDYGEGANTFWEADQFGWLFGNNFSGFIAYPDDREEGLEDVRFVFWFDN